MSVPESNIHRFTTGEFQQIDDERLLAENARVELLNGEFVEMTPIGSRHFACVGGLHELFFEMLGRGASVVAQSPIQLEGSQPRPDLAILRRREDWYAGKLPTPRDALVVVEVSETTGLLDRNVKRRLHARAAIAEYWVVDLGSGSVVVHLLPRGDDYDDVNEYPAGGSWTSPALGGREIRARDVLGPAVDAR
jgi:Uma2 family endonuclease